MQFNQVLLVDILISSLLQTLNNFSIWQMNYLAFDFYSETGDRKYGTFKGQTQSPAFELDIRIVARLHGFFYTHHMTAAC